MCWDSKYREKQNMAPKKQTIVYGPVAGMRVGTSWKYRFQSNLKAQFCYWVFSTKKKGINKEFVIFARNFMEHVDNETGFWEEIFQRK